MRELLPLFVDLKGRRVVLVGGGRVAAAKLRQLQAVGAEVLVVAPAVHEEILASAVAVAERPFVPEDLDGAWLVVAAATPAVNRQVAEAAEARRVFVNAVDDPPNATAYLSGVVRRAGVTLAISTNGDAPALTGLVREALEAVLPDDLDAWMAVAREERLRWRREGVPMEKRRALLLEALNEIYDSGPAKAGRRTARDRYDGRGQRQRIVSTIGYVWLVGAGPGDPGLLTRKALVLLRRADLVLYDALVDERVVALARRAQRFFVGKRAGQQQLSQPEIQAVMIQAARRGRRVVRLKGGDPFVFGRGGEEAQALQRAGIPFDIVPGVTSVIAAPASAGIPLTHRGVASGFLVVSGHDAEAFSSAVGGLLPGQVTLTVLMGSRRRVAIAAELIARGWDRTTPAAIVTDGTLAHGEAWRGTLGELAEDNSQFTKNNLQGRPDGPAIIVIGGVAALDVRSNHNAESAGKGEIAPASRATRSR